MDNSNKGNTKYLGQVVPFPAPIVLEGKPKTVEITYFQGAANGIEDIDCPPDHDGQGREMLEDQAWADQPTPYDP